MKNRKQYLFYLLIVLLIISCVYKCPYSLLFGIPCPGCGMTRAFFALAQGNVKDAFYYHPLFPLVILLSIGWLLNYFKLISITQKQKDLILWTSIFLFIITYLIRIYLGSDVLNFDFHSSLLYQLFRYIKISYM